MAQINLTIQRDNGTNVSGGAEVEDIHVVEIAALLGALIFDASTAPPELAELPE